MPNFGKISGMAAKTLPKRREKLGFSTGLKLRRTERDRGAI